MNDTNAQALNNDLATIEAFMAETPSYPAVVAMATWLFGEDAVDLTLERVDALLDSLGEVEDALPEEVYEATMNALMTYKWDNYYEQPNCYVPGLGWTVA